MTNSIQINGVTMIGGRSITVKGGKVIIDGQDVTPDAKTINISVTGHVEMLSVDHAEKVEVTGTCGSVKTMSGNVACEAVNGPVKTMSGNVIAGTITGASSTMSGSIINKCGQ